MPSSSVGTSPRRTEHSHSAPPQTEASHRGEALVGAFPAEAHWWEPSQQECTQGEAPHWEGTHRGWEAALCGASQCAAPCSEAPQSEPSPWDGKVPNGDDTWRQTEGSHPSVGMLPPRWEGSHAWPRGREPSHRWRVEGSQGRAPLSARARVLGSFPHLRDGKLPSGKLANEATQLGTRQGRGLVGIAPLHQRAACNAT